MRLCDVLRWEHSSESIDDVRSLDCVVETSVMLELIVRPHKTKIGAIRLAAEFCLEILGTESSLAG